MPNLNAEQSFFVTGGSGYVGRNVLRELYMRGHKVKALARSGKSAAAVSRLGATPVLGDMSDKEILQNGMAGVDYLIHVAANTEHGTITDVAQRESDTANHNVFQAAKAAGVSRVVHLSTEAVLLDGGPLFNADETIDYPTRPAGDYSKTKAQAERIALSYSQDGFEVVVVRPRFIWGRDDTTALPQLIDAAKSGKLSWIDGGNYLTATTHIANVVHGIMLALEKGRAGEVYFLSDGDPVAFRTFISDLLTTQNVEAPTKSVPRWLVAPVVKIGSMLAAITNGKISGPMSAQEYATLGFEVTLNINKARKELGYQPVISIKDGMAELKTTKFT